jgi:hypothetical protein
MVAQHVACHLPRRFVSKSKKPNNYEMMYENDGFRLAGIFLER